MSMLRCTDCAHKPLLIGLPGISPGPHPDEPIIIPDPSPLIRDEPKIPIPEPEDEIDPGTIGDQPIKSPNVPPLDPPHRNVPPPAFHCRLSFSRFTYAP